MKRVYLGLLTCVLFLAVYNGKNTPRVCAGDAEGGIDETVFERYARTIWIPYEWKEGEDYGNDVTPFTFYLYREGGEIVGRISTVIEDPPCVSYDYYMKYADQGVNLSGTILGDKIECRAESGAYNGIFYCGLNEDGTMDVLLEESGETLLFRPYLVSDMGKIKDGWESMTLDLNSWGTVNLIYGVIDSNKPHPVAVLAGEGDEMYYYFRLSFLTGSEIENIIVEDVNGDGLSDIKFISYFPGYAEPRLERTFYQMENGFFYI